LLKEIADHISTAQANPNGERAEVRGELHRSISHIIHRRRQTRVGHAHSVALLKPDSLERITTNRITIPNACG
jgi:hypothetical protein